MTTRATEFSTPSVELQVGVPSGRGKATFPSSFRPHSPITTRVKCNLMVVTCACYVMRQAPVGLVLPGLGPLNPRCTCEFSFLLPAGPREYVPPRHNPHINRPSTRVHTYDNKEPSHNTALIKNITSPGLQRPELGSPPTIQYLGSPIPIMGAGLITSLMLSTETGSTSVS